MLASTVRGWAERPDPASGNALMEDRSGLVVNGCLIQTTGHAERTAALHMIEPRDNRATRITLDVDNGYDAQNFAKELHTMSVASHIAAKAKAKGPAIDDRTNPTQGL